MSRKFYCQLILMALLVSSCSEDGNDILLNQEYNHKQNVGKSAHDLLSGESYTSLEIEILYMPGYAPQSESITNLRNFLNRRLYKSGGITIVTHAIPASMQDTLSTEDIAKIEQNNRTVFSDIEAGKMGLSLIITNGAYTQKRVLGIAYWNTSMAIFGETIHQNTGEAFQPSTEKLETTIMLHEIGHLLGLVNTGSVMQQNHDDTEHESHCNNNECLMYYAAQVSDLPGPVFGEGIPQLDQNCLNDLRGNGGK